MERNGQVSCLSGFWNHTFGLLLLLSSRVTLIKKSPLFESQFDKAVLTVSIEQGCGKDPHNACKIPRTVPGTSKALLMLVFSATGSLMSFRRLSGFYHLGVI